MYVYDLIGLDLGWNEHGVFGNGTQDNVLVPCARHLDQMPLCMGPLGGREKWLAQELATLMSRKIVPSASIVWLTLSCYNVHTQHMHVQDPYNIINHL